MIPYWPFPAFSFEPFSLLAQEQPIGGAALWTPALRPPQTLRVRSSDGIFSWREITADGVRGDDGWGSHYQGLSGFMMLGRIFQMGNLQVGLGPLSTPVI
jgi:hypothetical protein